MKIALICASPKHSKSASRVLLGGFAERLSCETETVELHSATLSEEQLETLSRCDAWVFSFPLYIDALPSHLLSSLCQLGQRLGGKGTAVCAICNCGFYEGHQTAPALEVMRCWCEREGLRWCGGVGFGGGGSLEYMAGVPLGFGPLTSVGKALDTMAGALQQGEDAGVQLVSINFPRFMYKIGAEGSWKRLARANGLSPRRL